MTTNGQPVYVTDANGTWGSVTEVPGAPGGSGSFSGVSCTGASDCTAVGQDADGQPIYATESHGVWSTGDRGCRCPGWFGRVRCRELHLLDKLYGGGCGRRRQSHLLRQYAGSHPANSALTSDDLPPVVTSPTSTNQHGYWLVGSDGGIFTFGDAQFYGSTGALKLQRPVVGITPTSNDGGYWLVASDGGIFSFGNAAFFNSIPGLGLHPASSGLPDSLNAPIVGMVPSADGKGYFMVGSDGGVFAFGDAKFEGSCPGLGGCAGAAVAVVPDASGNGYWLVTATGHVYSFGDAVYHGAPGPQAVPVTSAVPTADGGGYLDSRYFNGLVAPYGDASNLDDDR